LDDNLDLHDSISALTIAICYQNYITPEEAFGILEGKKKLTFCPTEKDREDMCKLRDQGMTYKQIGNLYGIDYTRTFKFIKNYKIKKDLARLQP